jgi:hypothetical protein
MGDSSMTTPRFSLAWWKFAAQRLALVALIAIGLAGTATADVTDLFMLRQGSTVAPGAAAGALLVNQFSRYDPNYVRRRAAFEERLDDNAKRIAQLEAGGRALPCTRQIFEEVKWLVSYTAYWQRVERRLADLEASFAVADQAFATRQSPDDGAWGACYEANFLKEAATLDGLDVLAGKGEPPKFAVTLDPTLQTSRQLVERMVNLILSDIASYGIDHCAELNSLMTTFVRGNSKRQLQNYAPQVKMLLQHRNPGGPLELRQRLQALTDAWQDPDTGFWGAWYKVDGGVVRTTDLSISFHIISYRRGKINYWPQVLKTLYAIKEAPYPYGWLSDGSYVNHNNYDVARILSYGWSHLSPQDQVLFRKELDTMLSWTLTKSLGDDGRFRSIPSFFESLGADYYYGVTFLDLIGFWDLKKRFWTESEFSNAPEVCMRIRRSMERDGLSDATAMDVRASLEAICPG